MNPEERKEITKISKQFAKGLGFPINGSRWLIADPLSGYLNALGYENELIQLPETDERPQVLIMKFKDGSQFIPAGADIPHKDSKNWMWL